jgi:diguanylate cyclase (GGDEF)-like protein
MPASEPSTAISEQLGLDSAWRETQMRLAALDNVDAGVLWAMGEFLGDRDQVAPVVAGFLDFLGGQAETSALLRGFDRNRLDQSITRYLNAYTIDFGGAEFFERLVSLVVTHVRLGVSLGLYLAALGYQRSLLLEQLVLAGMGKEQRQQLVLLLARLTSLETLVASEVYKRALARLDRRTQLGGRGLGLALDADAVLERDTLTGAVTRRVLMEAIDKALDTARKTGQGMTLILLEIDGFETLPAAEGDAALRAVRQMIKSSVREFDLIGRVGSQMFGVLLEGASVHTARQVADRVRRHVAAGTAQDKPISVSQGLAGAVAGDDQNSLFARCLRALERAREGGGDCVVEEAAVAAGR